MAIHVCPLPAVDALSLSFSVSLSSLCLSLFLSFSSLDLSLSLESSFSLSLCRLSRHQCDTTAMVRCGMLSLQLFWSPCMSPLFRQSTRALLSFSLSALFLSLFLSLSLSSLSPLCRLSRHHCDTTAMVRLRSLPLFWSPYMFPSFCSRRALSLFLCLSVSLSFSSLSLSLSVSLSLSALSLSLCVACRIITVMPLLVRCGMRIYLSFGPHASPLFLQSTRSLSHSLSLCLSVSLFQLFQLSLSLSVTCRII